MTIVEIVVSPTGETIVQTKGFTGASCQNASRLLEQALGTRITETLTAEFHQAAEAQQSMQEGA